MKTYQTFTTALLLSSNLVGCSSITRPVSVDPAPQVIATENSATDFSQNPLPKYTRPSASVFADLPTDMPSVVETTAQPDAILVFDDGLSRLDEAAEKKLANIARQLKAEKSSMAWLYGYVPGSGSNALSISLSERPLRMVRLRLEDLGVSPRRILLANFGQEHDRPHPPAGPWVEIYLRKE